MKNFHTPLAIIIASIIISLSILYYAKNDPISKCMDRVISSFSNQSSFGIGSQHDTKSPQVVASAAKLCAGSK